MQLSGHSWPTAEPAGADSTRVTEPRTVKIVDRIIDHPPGPPLFGKPKKAVLPRAGCQGASILRHRRVDVLRPGEDSALEVGERAGVALVAQHPDRLGAPDPASAVDDRLAGRVELAGAGDDLAEGVQARVRPRVIGVLGRAGQ